MFCTIFLPFLEAIVFLQMMTWQELAKPGHSETTPIYSKPIIIYYIDLEQKPEVAIRKMHDNNCSGENTTTADSATFKKQFVGCLFTYCRCCCPTVIVITTAISLTATIS